MQQRLLYPLSGEVGPVHKDRLLSFIPQYKPKSVAASCLCWVNAKSNALLCADLGFPA